MDLGKFIFGEGLVCTVSGHDSLLPVTSASSYSYAVNAK